MKNLYHVYVYHTSLKFQDPKRYTRNLRFPNVFRDFPKLSFSLPFRRIENSKSSRRACLESAWDSDKFENPPDNFVEYATKSRQQRSWNANLRRMQEPEGYEHPDPIRNCEWPTSLNDYWLSFLFFPVKNTVDSTTINSDPKWKKSIGDHRPIPKVCANLTETNGTFLRKGFPHLCIFFSCTVCAMR